MNNLEFCDRLIDCTKNYKTLYVMGCFGAPMNQTNKKRWIQQEHYNYNNRPERVVMINHATDDTFGFDCVNLIKGILWGWNGDKNKEYGGVKYCSNGVPDIGADTMITKTENNKNWDCEIEKGEAVWLKGHIGVYVGDGLVVECSPKWKNCVQFSHLGNKGFLDGNSRIWTSHGHLPYVEYVKEEEPMLIYNTVKDCPTWAQEAVNYMVKKGYLKGSNSGLNLTNDMCRLLVVMHRMEMDRNGV